METNAQEWIKDESLQISPVNLRMEAITSAAVNNSKKTLTQIFDL